MAGACMQVTEMVVLPAVGFALLAVIVYVTAAEAAVGVPEMTPVVVLNVNPVFVFKFGLMVKLLGVPVVVGVWDVMAVPTANV
jgi:hypothetical protein